MSSERHEPLVQFHCRDSSTEPGERKRKIPGAGIQVKDRLAASCLGIVQRVFHQRVIDFPVDLRKETGGNVQCEVAGVAQRQFQNLAAEASDFPLSLSRKDAAAFVKAAKQRGVIAKLDDICKGGCRPAATPRLLLPPIRCSCAGLAAGCVAGLPTCAAPAVADLAC